MSPNQNSVTPNLNNQPEDGQSAQPLPNPNTVPATPEPVSSYQAPEIIQPTNSTTTSPDLVNTSSSPITAAPLDAPTPASQSTQQFSTPVTNSAYAIPTAGSTIQTQPLPSGDGGSNNPKKKKFIMAGAAAAAAVLLAGGVIFGWYVPNQPQNVYNIGINRSGKAMDKLLAEATKEEKLKIAENSELTGSLEFTSPDGTYKGSFNSKYDKQQSDSTVNYEQSGEGGEQKFDVRFLTDLAENKEYPDMFFQMNGLKLLGLDDFVPGISEYDGKWISVSSDYLKSVVPTETEEEQHKIEFTQKDAADLAAIFSSTTREYVFSTKPDKAILTQKSFVGTEKMDGGITANHYTMALNKANIKNYCKALTEAIMSADAYKRIPGVNTEKLDEDKKTAAEDCESSDDIDENQTFDMWIDKRNKLIHKFRITETEEKGNYYEVGQSYTKGDVIPMFATYHSDKEKIDGKLTLEYDTKKSITKGTLTYDMTYGGAGSFDDSTGDVIRDTATETEKYSAKASFEFKPFSGDVTIEKPANAIPIEEVMEKFGVDPAEFSDSGSGGSSSSVSGRAQDSERKADIMAIHTQLEAYYADNGVYPSLKDLNSVSWRTTNMRSLNDDAIISPDGPQATLASANSPSQYSYTPSQCGGTGKDCQLYSLSAILSDGTVYTKQSLN